MTDQAVAVSRRIVILFTFALLCVPACAGQLPALTSDRPDQTESAETVVPGAAQFEVGWTHAEEDDEGFDLSTDAFPQTLIRYGLAENLELRLGFDGYVWQDVEEPAGESVEDDGAGDSEIGFKYKLWNEQGRRPQTAVLVGTSLPTGEDPFSSERLDPSIRLAFAHTLSDALSLGYNVAGIWETEQDETGDRDTTASIAYSAALGIALTHRAGTFVEFFGSVPTDEGKPANSFDAGLTYLITDNLQLDVLGGAGVSEAADDWFIGAGVVYRIAGTYAGPERRRPPSVSR